MYISMHDESNQGFTAKQDVDGRLDIREESIYLSIGEEDVKRSPEAAAFIVAWLSSVLEDIERGK